MTVNERINRNVKAIAALKGFDLGDVYAAAGTSRQAWSKAMKSKRVMGLDRLELLADYLDATPDELLAEPALLLARMRVPAELRGRGSNSQPTDSDATSFSSPDDLVLPPVRVDLASGLALPSVAA